MKGSSLWEWKLETQSMADGLERQDVALEAERPEAASELWGAVTL